MRAPIRVSRRTLIRLARLGQALCLLMSLSGFIIILTSASPAQAQGRCQSVCVGENANPDSCSWCERIEHGVGAGTMAAGSLLTLGGLMGATLLGQLCQGLEQGAGVPGAGASGVATATDGTPEEGASTTTATGQTTGDGEESGKPPSGHYYGGFGRGAPGGEGGQPAAEGGDEAGGGTGRPAEVEGTGPRPAVTEGEGETFRPVAPEGGTPPTGPATDAARNRWQLLGADADGRIYDASRQHILNIDANGDVTDLNGRPVSHIERNPGYGTINHYVDADGNRIMSTRRMGLIDMDSYQAVDAPQPAGPPQPLTGEVAARWTAVGAGPSGELRAPDGNILGRIDTDGNMWTVDGKPISGASFHDAGRLQWFNTADGQHWEWSDSGEFRSSQMPEGEPFRPLSEAELKTRAAQRAPTFAEADQPLPPGPDAQRPGTAVEGESGGRHLPPARGTVPAGDRTIADEPDLGTRVPADADTKVEGGRARGAGGEGTRGGDTLVEGEGPGVRPGPGGETRVEGGEAGATDTESGEARAGSAEGGEARATGAEGGEARPASAEGGEVRPSGAEGGEARPSGAEGGEARTTGAEGESRPAGADAEGGSLAGAAFSRTMDLKSVQDLYNQHIAEGKSPAEALSLAVAQTGAGNVVAGMGIIDPRASAAASALLPGGMRNILPEQAVQNWMGTGYDALDALGESVGSSLGSGELDTSAFDRFAEGVANRPGADPFKGIGQAVELATEEIYRSDGGNLVSDLKQIYETGAGADVANEAMTEFQQAVEQGKYGAPLQGINHLISGASEVIADPTTTVGQFFKDVKNIYNYGVGDGFWSEAVDTTAEVIKNTPIANTIYEGYHEVFSGVAQQGVTGFASEMAEGASALAGEAYDAAANSLADAANSTYHYIKSWF